jgi:hypothetical protein
MNSVIYLKTRLNLSGGRQWLPKHSQKKLKRHTQKILTSYIIFTQRNHAAVTLHHTPKKSPVSSVKAFPPLQEEFYCHKPECQTS